MKNLLYCAAIANSLSSCNQTNQNENGRYLPAALNNGTVYIVDSQTGRLYYGNLHDMRELIELEVNGSQGIKYVDFVEGAQKAED